MDFVNVTNSGQCICFNEHVVVNDFVLDLIDENPQHYAFNNLLELSSLTNGTLFTSLFLSTLYNITSTDMLSERSGFRL